MKLLLVRSAPAPLPVGAVSSLEKIWREESPDCILFAGSSALEQLAARLSARLGAPCCTGAINVSGVESVFKVTRRVYGGELLADYIFPFPCLIVLDRDVEPGDISLPVEPVAIEPDYTSENWYGGFEASRDETAGELKSAAGIIAAGRGVKSKARFQTVVELAGKLGAAVGATRPAVYSGWAPLGTQIGVSGTSVKPEVCLIIAASGSQAFMGAIGKNTRIIAVNNDPEAAVFRRADWGVVCDGNEMLRELMTLTDNFIF